LRRQNQSLAIGVALAAFVFAVGGTVLQINRLQGANVEVNLAKADVAKAAEQRQQADAAAEDPRFAASEGSSAEEMMFVDGLRREAELQGLQIRAIGGSMLSKLELPQASKEAQAQVENMKEVATNITVAGPYLGIRSFLRNVVNTDRLCNLRSLKWSRTATGPECSVTLARYINTKGGAS
jgi:Tfp pilus assembly protein PilO